MKTTEKLHIMVGRKAPAEELIRLSKKTYTSESYEFLVLVRQYKKLHLGARTFLNEVDPGLDFIDPEEVNVNNTDALGAWIYMMYVSEDADRQINITGKTRSELDAAADLAPGMPWLRNSFNTAYNEITHMIVGNEGPSINKVAEQFNIG